MEIGTASTPLDNNNNNKKMALAYCFGSKETHILEQKADDLEQTLKIFGKYVTYGKLKVGVCDSCRT